MFHESLSHMTQRVQRYYDQNTPLFLAFARSREVRSIHRAVWEPGVQELRQALQTINRRLLAALAPLLSTAEPVVILDIGCGVGGSLLALAEQLAGNWSGIGLTISALQARVAHHNAEVQHLQRKCRFLQADFHNLPLQQRAHAAYAIEAFIHSAAPARFFAQLAGVLRPGGLLLICDDFLSEYAAQAVLTQQEQALLQAFAYGWHAAAPASAQQTIEIARQAGFELLSNEDLTVHLRLRSLPRRLANPLLQQGLRLPWPHPIIPGLLGGLALQQCLQQGLLRYQLISLRYCGSHIAG